MASLGDGSLPGDLQWLIPKPNRRFPIEHSFPRKDGGYGTVTVDPYQVTVRNGTVDDLNAAYGDDWVNVVLTKALGLPPGTQVIAPGYTFQPAVTDDDDIDAPDA